MTDNSDLIGLISNLMEIGCLEEAYFYIEKLKIDFVIS